MKKLTTLLVVTLSLLTSSRPAPATTSSATLTSISVTPVNPSVAIGLTLQFTATGNYSDGSTQNLTNSAT
jgi:trimeric autotransporter adhesin